MDQDAAAANPDHPDRADVPAPRPGPFPRAFTRAADWVVHHPLSAGWIWVGAWAGLIILDDFLDRAGWAWYFFVALAALPTLLATLAVLAATPRRHLKPAAESVLGHFVVRFLALIGAFLVWGVSVVLSASISTAISSAGGNDDRQVTALGFHLLLVSVPLVIIVLWLALIIRCAWFLRRLRGWRQVPADSQVPDTFLRNRPRLRRTVIGFAHPGLLLVAGLGMSVLGLLLDAVDVTLNVLI